MSKTALVTGCSSGIGRLTADRLHAAGWRVILTLRGGAARAAELGIAQRPNLHILGLDVTAGEDRSAAANFIARESSGHLDALILNAGYALFGALEDLSDDRIRAQFETNVLGQIMLTRELLPALREARGRIVAVSSVFGAVVFPLTSLYCASKFALEGFVRSLRHELASHGVQASLIRPGRHRTRFGANIVWGDGDVAAYRGQTAAYRRLRERLAARQGGEAEAVAAAIERLLECRRMPPAIAVGGDSRGLLALERLLPAAWSDRLLGHLYGRLFASEQAR